jgi:cytochrome P450
LPVYVIASLLGVPQYKLSQTAVWLDEFVRCVSPGGSPEQIARGKVSAGYLTDLFRLLLDPQQTESDDGLLNTLAQELKRVGRDDKDVVVANGIGFLFQAYEATAGLLVNTLVALSVHPDVREQVKAESGLLSNAIEEVIRSDPSIQNTRRFVIRDGIVAGQKMKEGDTVLVVLAAANRDPMVNSNPEKFDIFRKERCSFTFGIGIHACPGQKIAASIAEIGIKRLLEERINFEQFPKSVSYRQSENTRIPVFAK